MINFSEQAGELVRAGEIEVDFFKAPEWEWIVAPAEKIRPVRVHFDVQIGYLRAWTYDRVTMRRWMERTGTTLANVHLSPNGSEVWVLDPLQCDAAAVERVTTRLHKDLSIYVDTFGAGNVVVENMPFWNSDWTWTCKPGVLPGVIHEIVTTHGCGLLLDFGHAKIAAAALGMDAREYIVSLPVRNLRECHISGVVETNGRLNDHAPMQPPDWDLLAWGMDNIRAGRWGKPWALAFEYGGMGDRFAWRSDRNVIREQAPRIREMIKTA